MLLYYSMTPSGEEEIKPDVLRRAQRGQKPHVEQKSKCSLAFDFQYEYRP